MPPVLVPFEVGALRRVLVFGTGTTGRAVAAALTARGVEVVTADDRPDAEADHPAVEETVLAGLVTGADAVAPAPGVPRHHAVYRLAEAAGRPIVSELDLAAAWTAAPVLAVTGTNGKTTVTRLLAAILREHGLDVELVGNNDEPLVAAIDRRGSDPDAWVVEASSFRLDAVQHFTPLVAVWLNLAPDHLDWHPDVEDYAAAKARVVANAGPGTTLVVPLDDPAVDRAVAGMAAERSTFGPGADWEVSPTRLRGPVGEVAFSTPLARRRPHELADAAAAAAAAGAFGVPTPVIARAVAAFEGVEHRLMPVGEIDGVVYYDDSKATAPHATKAAVSGFESVVLIAGGRNKGLDLCELREIAGPVRHVVAIGEAAPDVVHVFEGVVPVTVAGSMEEAVATARRRARPGDAVLLSPACASFDWYRNFGERGDDFARIVRTLAEEGS
jgi:UDP-N-acetylmuramoylalanine--D-glutamate ligase